MLLARPVPIWPPSAKKIASLGTRDASPRSVLAGGLDARVPLVSTTNRSFSNRALETLKVGACAASWLMTAAALGWADARSVWIPARSAFMSMLAVSTRYAGRRLTAAVNSAREPRLGAAPEWLSRALPTRSALVPPMSSSAVIAQAKFWGAPAGVSTEGAAADQIVTPPWLVLVTLRPALARSARTRSLTAPAAIASLTPTRTRTSGTGLLVPGSMLG